MSWIHPRVDRHQHSRMNRVDSTIRLIITYIYNRKMSKRNGQQIYFSGEGGQTWNFWKNYRNFTNRDYHGISVADTELLLIKISQTCFN